MFILSLSLPVNSSAISVSGDDTDMTAICEIGRDDDIEACYSACVSFTRDIGVESYSVRYWLLQRTAEGAERSIWDGSEARAFIIHSDDRQVIRATFMACASRLLETFCPARLDMFTYSAELPERALTKFTELANIIVASGYHVTREPPHYGRHAWIFER